MTAKIREAFFDGVEDRHYNGLLRNERLYRPWLLHVAWRAGWEFANALTTRPLRTERRTDNGAR